MKSLVWIAASCNLRHFRYSRLIFRTRRCLTSILDSTSPDWLVNCAALANLEECEANPERAKMINVDVPAELAKACAERGIRFVHISTDAVFDGKKKDPYVEGDIPNPFGVLFADKTRW